MQKQEKLRSTKATSAISKFTGVALMEQAGGQPGAAGQHWGDATGSAHTPVENERAQRLCPRTRAPRGHTLPTGSLGPLHTHLLRAPFPERTSEPFSLRVYGSALRVRHEDTSKISISLFSHLNSSFTYSAAFKSQKALCCHI